MTTTTTTRLTRQQVTALRAMLAAPGPISERIDAAIDACRSPQYHRLRAAYESECAIRRQQSQAIDDIPAVPTERVPGATELRTWLAKTWAGISTMRKARAKRRTMPAQVALRVRCQSAVARAVLAAYSTCGYRKSESRWAGGEHSVSIEIVPAGRESARGESTRAWSANGKWSGLNSEHRLAVSLRWRLDVERPGLATVAGQLVLAATTVDELRDGEECYEVLLVAQGRGFALETKSALVYRRSPQVGWTKTASLAAARRAVSKASASSCQAVA